MLINKIPLVYSNLTIHKFRVIFLFDYFLYTYFLCYRHLIFN